MRVTVKVRKPMSNTKNLCVIHQKSVEVEREISFPVGRVFSFLCSVPWSGRDEGAGSTQCGFSTGASRGAEMGCAEGRATAWKKGNENGGERRCCLGETAVGVFRVFSFHQVLKRNKKKRKRASKFPLDISTSFVRQIYITVYCILAYCHLNELNYLSVYLFIPLHKSIGIKGKFRK